MFGILELIFLINLLRYILDINYDFNRYLFFLLIREKYIMDGI